VPTGSAACLQAFYRLDLTRASFSFDTGEQYLMPLLARIFCFAMDGVVDSTARLRESRFDHSWGNRGYDNGTARNQFFFGMDLIYKF
jgi:hypothetical protein